ncbi:hypothetical protein AC579_7602 [Pseudocercospora musae]|uniref:Nonsense-mediated mRNA decay factor n=1 Tax=Pseudocercospora musae TaxID=113226 RepID=A0A139IDX9_9PEZI|nr:hypothetical protein AC579_7602 [Pseudocercospora musae]
MSRNYGESKALEQEVDDDATPTKYTGHIRHFGDGSSHDYARQSALSITTSHDDSPPSSQALHATNLCASPLSCPSEASMHNHVETETPPDTFTTPYSANRSEPTAEGLSRLCLHHVHSRRASLQGRPSPERGRCSHTHNSPAVTTKRSASSELARPECDQPPYPAEPLRQQALKSSKTRQQKRALHARQTPSKLASGDAMNPHRILHGQLPRDSGYESNFPSRHPTHTSFHPPARRSAVQTITGTALPDLAPRCDAEQIHSHSDRPVSNSNKSRFPGLILQPDSSPISQDQLAAEVKGIYAGLVMVEAKCINIDAAQAADSKSHLGPEQWQALIALHRTLLYEHHDFLMATQHPSATQALRGLATKYSMPARMWKHGIHAFLEVLRHRRPDSQEYMLAFIYLAYQMMALLFETVPSFTDTWIECLGDLARYRMAIEEEKESHATWGGVAARWYTMASDRHPAIGRLYHHLGILERPSLRKFCFYAKSLTCVIPFPNARDSLSTLCGPIVQDDQTIQSSRQSAEARIVTFHALLYTGRDQELIDDVGRDALDLLHQQPNKLRDFGAYLAVTNVAAIFELGAPTNSFWQLYSAAINQAMQSSRPSLTSSAHTDEVLSQMMPSTGSSPLLASCTAFFSDCFDFVLRQYNSPGTVKDCLGFVHITLVWIHSLHALRTWLNNSTLLHTFDVPNIVGRLSWGILAKFLNTLASLDSVTDYVLERARQGNFLGSESNEELRPLSEDYTIRGLVWGQFYFSPGWFDGQCEDDGRSIETPSMAKARVERVLWLGLYLAFHTDYLQYDVQNKIFSASDWGHSVVTSVKSAHPAVVAPADVEMEQVSEAVNLSPRSRSSKSHSSSSSGSSEDGFKKIKKPRMTACTYAKAVTGKPSSTPPTRPRKVKQDFNNFQVVDENGTEWTMN